jgi:two-component system C4-dicarboxylate transport response regulator DctD
VDREPTTIVVVDDNLELADNLAEILAVAGYRTVTASSAEEARVLIRDGECAAVITDFRLPGKSGADLIRDLREASLDVPVIVMSAYADAAAIAGALHVLAKPVDIDRLLAIVAALGARAAGRALAG